MKKNVLLSLGISLAAVAVTSGVTYAIKRNGGLKSTVDKIKLNPVIASAVSKIGELREQLVANDSTDYGAAA